MWKKNKKHVGTKDTKTSEPTGSNYVIDAEIIYKMTPVRRLFVNFGELS